MILDFGIIVINLNPLLEIAGASPLAAFWYLFKYGGFIPVVYAFFLGAKWFWMEHIEEEYAHKWKWVLLLIDVPKENIQTPKAVENIFAQLGGAHSRANFIEKYWKGKVQETFSFEITSQEGYIRFYVRATEQFRDLVEAAFYAQYPDAEIMEVDDYTVFAPKHFPDKDYDLWGTEFVLQNEEAYPIRTYPEFEHQLSQEFMDPMAALLESMSKLGAGEHCWLQIIVKPISDEWKEEGIKIAKKLVGAKVEEKYDLIEKTLGISSDVVIKTFDAFLEIQEEESKEKREPVSLVQFLTPGERRIVESIQFKIAKLGFKVKFRMIYLGKKEVFHKGRGVSPILGALKQFSILDANSFKPYKKVTTKINYFMIKRRVAARQIKIMRSYKNRSMQRGAHPYVLNIEELASIFHFPVSTVKAPLVKKTESKRAEPPIGLPVETSTYEAMRRAKIKKEESEAEALSEPPENLPTAEF
ncbi:MAG: hypothetical protein Q8M83_05870 [bacterium]|nr:hypothetical protein [bacterium]